MMTDRPGWVDSGWSGFGSGGWASRHWEQNPADRGGNAVDFRTGHPAAAKLLTPFVPVGVAKFLTCAPAGELTLTPCLVMLWGNSLRKAKSGGRNDYISRIYAGRDSGRSSLL
jgi:hypothetical protein